MKILITNDDGINGEGLNPLINILKRNSNKLAIIVPDRERSAISQAITLNSPIRMQKINNNFYTIDGTPADCVYLTMLGAIDFKPGLVISGINRGPNLGEDIIYSGTVAAAIEACIHRVTAIAVSIDGMNGSIHYDSAAEIALDCIKILCKAHLKGILFNINVPNLPLKKIRGIKITRMASRRYFDRLIKRKDPQGNPYFWLKSNKVEWTGEKGTDYFEVKKGYVSITPLHLDQTAHPCIDILKKIIRGGKNRWQI